MSSSVISSNTSATSSAKLSRMNPIASQRAKKEIEKRRGDIKTFTTPIIFAGDVDRKAFLQSHYKKFTNSKKTSMYRLQVMKKYPTTVAKHYHDLVEHSGKVTSEEFWLRYDYRCCDVSRVIQEVQATRQESKKQLMKEKKKKKNGKKTASKDSTHVEEYKKEASRSAKMSWMNIRSLASSKKKTKSSAQVGVEAAATVDTADEDIQNSSATNHIDQFKRSIGGADFLDTTSVDDINAPEEVLEVSDVAGIFRDQTEKDSSDDVEKEVQWKHLKMPLFLVGVWLLTVFLAFVLQFPASWTSSDYNCAPIRPGSTLEAQALVDKIPNDGKLVLTAPWWVPPSMKKPVFNFLCATDSHGNHRKQTQVTFEVPPVNLFQGQREPTLSVSLKSLSGDEVGEELIKVRSVKTFGASPSGSELRAVKPNGAVKDYQSPWAIV